MLALKNLVGRRDKIEFAQTVTRYDRKLKVIFSPTKTSQILLQILGFSIYKFGKSFPEKYVFILILN